MDRWDKSKRSLVMSRIRSKNTKPERLLRSGLHKRGLRFRIHKKDLPGKPDIVFPSKKVVVFVHGCFWHLHENCVDGRIPKSNTGYWEHKLQRNIQKDKLNIYSLKKMQWNVIVVWECEIEKKIDSVILKIVHELSL
jgi:DNA mismatch endonuclease (patch repair protein)